MAEWKKQNLNFRIATLESGNGPLGKRRKPVPFSPDKIYESWVLRNCKGIRIWIYYARGNWAINKIWAKKIFSSKYNTSFYTWNRSNSLVGEDVVFGNVIKEEDDKGSNY